MNLLVLATLWIPLLITSEFRRVNGTPALSIWATVTWIIACVLAATIRIEHCPLSRQQRGYLALVIAALAAVAPTPLREGAISIGVLLLLSIWTHRAIGPLYLSVGLAVAATVHWLLPRALPVLAGVDILAELSASIGRLLGADVVATERALSYRASDGRFLEIGMSLGHLDVRILLSVAAGLVSLVSIYMPKQQRGRSIVILLLAIMLALGIRVLWNWVAYLETGNTGVFLHAPTRALVLGLPVLLVLAAALPRRIELGNHEGVASHRCIVAICALGCLTTLTAFAAGPTLRNRGSVAIAEGHSDWERLDLPFDQVMFGTRSVYNYAEWMRLIEASGYPVVRLGTHITTESLADSVVLVVKAPTRPFADEEVDVINTFVHNGGGLFLVGDHTNVFGMNTILNGLSKHFGITFEANAVFEADREGGAVTHSQAYPPHPIVSTLRPMHWMTACSITVSGAAIPLLWVSSSFADDPNFGTYTFFGNSSLDPGEPLGWHTQVACSRFGSGRVLAFGDSTVFSNFSVCFPGNREFALGGVEWLASHEAFPWWPAVAVCFSSLIVILAIVWGAPGIAWATAFLGGAGVGMWLSRQTCIASNSEFNATLASKECVFDTLVSFGQLPLWHQSHDEPNQFESLFLLFERSGRIMRVAIEGDRTFSGNELVVTWPKAPINSEYLSALRAFVADGGTLFLFDDGRGVASAANSILELFGMSVTWHSARVLDSSRFVHNGRMLVCRDVGTISGGQGLLHDDVCEPLIACKPYGAGWIFASGIAEQLSNSCIGSPHGLVNEDSFDIVRAFLFSLSQFDELRARGTQ